MPHDEWSFGEDEDEVPGCKPAREPGESPAGGEADRHRRMMRAEITRSWREVGVDFGSYEKRQEHGRLYEWVRERKRLRESRGAKAQMTLIGAVVSALVAAAATLLTGLRH